MAIPARSRWWIVTLLVVALLVAISALALDRPNVVWSDSAAHCPYCRKAVEEYSSRCGTCRGDFDWTIAPAAESPISTCSLSLLETDWVRARVEELGVEEAARLVALDAELSHDAAREYLATVGRGRCGWCGGTRKDLSATDLLEAPDCPLCLGDGTSIDCGVDRRVQRGNGAAEQALQAYRAEMADLRRSALPAEIQQKEARRLAEDFLSRFAGTTQAAQIWFWPRVSPDRGLREDRDMAAAAARHRLEDVVEALRPRK